MCMWYATPCKRGAEGPCESQCIGLGFWQALAPSHARMNARSAAWNTALLTLSQLHEQNRPLGPANLPVLLIFPHYRGYIYIFFRLWCPNDASLRHLGSLLFSPALESYRVALVFQRAVSILVVPQTKSTYDKNTDCFYSFWINSLINIDDTILTFLPDLLTFILVLPRQELFQAATDCLRVEIPQQQGGIDNHFYFFSWFPSWREICHLSCFLQNFKFSLYVFKKLSASGNFETAFSSVAIDTSSTKLSASMQQTK